MPEWITTTLELVGFVAIVVGCAMIAVPLAFIVAGALMVALGVLAQ